MGSNVRVKTELIQVRASPEEKAKLKDKADKFGISVGELCRETIFNAIPNSKTDQAAIAELALSRADLGRLGGLLKGWLAGSFAIPPPLNPEEVRALLKEIESSQFEVIKSVNHLIRKI